MEHQALVRSQPKRAIAAPSRRRPWLTRLLPYVLLTIYFTMGLAQVVSASVTFDEGPHLAAGYTLLRTGDFRLQPIHIHPPLANVVAALPLLFQRDLPDPATVNGWEINSLSAITDAVVWQYPHPQRIAVAGRVPMLLFGVVLGALVFRWGRDLGGSGAGMLALGLLTFDPSILAHGALITTDIVATTLIVATLYVLYRAADRRAQGAIRVGHLLLLGLLLGLAQLAKVSALMLLPVVGALLLWRVPAQRDGRDMASALGRFALVLAVCGVTVWAGYGFSVIRPQGWPFALPAGVHISIYQSLQEHYTLGHPTYAMGRVSSTGWWWYFPLTFVLKTPLPILILGLLSLSSGLIARRRDRASVEPGRRSFGRAREWVRSQLREGPASVLFVALFPMGYVAAALFSTVNIGYRHLLPILPLLYIGLGLSSVRWLSASLRVRHAARGIVVLLGVWLIAGTVVTLPYPLTFFNEIAGGPAGGYRYLVDSNLDWGQNLWDLRGWLAQQGEAQLYYAHYSPADPAMYGVPVEFLPPDPRAGAFSPWHPKAGLYAIGATVLQGPYAPDLNTFAWFRAQEPARRLGHALFVYRVPEREAPTWAVRCESGPVDAATIRRNLGAEQLRVLEIDCTRVFVVPAASGPGIGVTGAGEAPLPGAAAAFGLRDHHGVEVGSAQILERASLSVAGSVRRFADGPLVYLGSEVQAPTAADNSVVVHTFWEVETVSDRPLSLMVHLTGSDPAPLAVGDAMAFPLDQWQPGDIVRQTHQLELPAHSTPGAYSLSGGAYWLDTLERWQLSDGQDSFPIGIWTVE